MRPLLYDLELAFNPGMSDITWVSSEIPSFCEHVEAKLIKVGCFIKEVRAPQLKFKSFFFLVEEQDKYSV